jgi:hypothetical protein
MNRELLLLQIKEEWRMTTSYFRSQILFLLFPFILVVIGYITGVILPIIEEAFEMELLIEGGHLLFVLYGLFVGGFGFFADAVAQQWFGEARLLLQMHEILPISFKKLFSFFYLKDIVYYLFFTVYPPLFGLAISGSLSLHLFITLTISLTLSFLLGLSLSFFLSSLSVRNPWALMLLLPVGGYFFLSDCSFSDLPPLVFFFDGPLSSLLISLAMITTLSVLSLIITVPVERYRTSRYSPFSLFSRDALLAKEIVELRRSGTWRILLTSYLFPLIFLYGIFYFSGRLLQLEITIPLPFYAVFIGYLSTLVYSWLNNIDSPSYLRTLPVTITAVIKRKILLFVVLSVGIGMGYLLVLSHALDDVALLPLSLFAMTAVSLYIAAVISYLCGLFPNTYLFNGIILAQYLMTTLPALLLLTILSLMEAYTELLLLSALIGALALLLSTQLEARYGNLYFLPWP